MKVFEFTADGYKYAIAANDQQAAEICLADVAGVTKYDHVTEVSESKWGEKNIKMHEDNDTEKEPFYISIMEAINGDEPQLVYSSDTSVVD